MNIILFDPEEKQYFLPLAFTRAVADIRFGALKIIEKWQKAFPTAQVSYLTEPYLAEKFTSSYTDENYYISGNLVPDENLIKAIGSLKMNDALLVEDETIALKSLHHYNLSDLYKFIRKENFEVVEYNQPIIALERIWDLFEKAGEEIQNDLKYFASLKADKAKIEELRSLGNTLIGDDLYIHPSAKVYASTINSTLGPVILLEDSEVMEGSLIRGSLVLGAHATLKMGTKIYGPTAIGPYCKIGGEVNNCSFQAYSNKGHDGFTGNSIFGEWCNLGADTNTSNLKNNYSTIKLWDFEASTYLDSNMQFCGTIMGDHSKTSINTMLNTGTVIGVFANIFDYGFPPKHIPSFFWGNSEKSDLFELKKAKTVAQKMMERRNLTLTPEDEKILDYLFAKAKGARR